MAHRWNRGAVCGLVAILFAATWVMPGVAPVTAQSRCGEPARPQVDWAECPKSGLVLVKQQLERAHLVRVDFSATDLSEANLAGADLGKVTLTRAWLVGANLQKASLASSYGLRTRFDGARLAAADLSKAELSRASFVDADLAGIDGRGAQIPRGRFKGANLGGAKLADTNLSRADFRGATLAGANMRTAYLYMARFEGVDLSRVSGLTQAQIDTACGDAKTVLPSGLKAPRSWPCPPPDPPDEAERN